jgi:hypothetical protein
VDDKELHFGSAGLIYQGALVVYDNETKSLWTPITGKCLTGDYVDKRLKLLPTVPTTWKYWREQHAATNVLVGADPPLEGIDYTKNPQLPTPDYRESNLLAYPVEGFDPEGTPVPPKEVVFGVQVGNDYRAYPRKALAEKKEISDKLGGAEIRASYDEAGGFAVAKDAAGNELLCQRMFWIVWKGFHPRSDAFGASEPVKEETPFRVNLQGEPSEAPKCSF